MIDLLQIIDQSLDYSEDIKSQIDNLLAINQRNKSRITVMDIMGNVVADSDISDYNNIDNHLNREEIQEALKAGIGYAKRKSNTLGIPMLYVSYLSRQGNYILRISMPYSGLINYMVYLLPAILLSLGISLIVSIILGNRFSRSITKPLYEISEELLKINEDNSNLSFRNYEYYELNLIANTTKQMADAIRESMKKIEFEKMVRQEFFANVSHELKTPITSIRGYIELLENGMATDEKMKKEFMARIKKESQNMANLINDILMISRLETKEAEVIISEVRICPIVNDLIASLKPLASENNISIDINCKPIILKANEGQIKELFNNLIVNAIKYNKPGGKVNITVSKEGNDAIFIVEDTGVGIPEESKARVFERFYRVDKGRSKKIGGTGLGLSIVKHIVNYYNGSIKLESELGRGSKFTIRIPLN
jgi:two-component system phosphate regulon sensor histidine kinase PhoR